MEFAAKWLPRLDSPLIGAPLVHMASCPTGIGVQQKETTTIRWSFLFGSPCWTRTNDTAVNSRMLYRLS